MEGLWAGSTMMRTVMGLDLYLGVDAECAVNPREPQPAASRLWKLTGRHTQKWSDFKLCDLQWH